jgi:hypothetical protein
MGDLEFNEKITLKLSEVWIKIAHDRDQWQAFRNMSLNLGIS